MSSRKKYNTLGMSAEVWRLVEEKSLKEQRAKGWVVEHILADYFESEKKRETQYGEQT